MSKVSTSKSESFGDGEHHIVLMDFGHKKSILILVKRDCKVTVVPYHTSYDDINVLKPDGILLIKWTRGSKRH